MYKFVFVNTNMGYYDTYSLIETDLPLSSLNHIENSLNLPRSCNTTVKAFVNAANKFWPLKSNKYEIKILIEDTKEMTEEMKDLPIYYGYSGNY